MGKLLGTSGARFGMSVFWCYGNGGNSMIIHSSIDACHYDSTDDVPVQADEVQRSEATRGEERPE